MKGFPSQSATNVKNISYVMISSCISVSGFSKTGKESKGSILFMIEMVITQIEILFFALKSPTIFEILKINLAAYWSPVILYLGKTGILEEITVQAWQLSGMARIWFENLLFFKVSFWHNFSLWNPHLSPQAINLLEVKETSNKSNRCCYYLNHSNANEVIELPDICFQVISITS